MDVLYDPILGELRSDVEAGAGLEKNGDVISLASASSAYVYGVMRDQPITNVAATSYRVVLNKDHDVPGDALRYTKVDAFAALPAHNLRRCTVLPANIPTRTVNYYLNPSDSNLKADGTAAKLDGTDGDVLVHFPLYYWRLDLYTDENSKLWYVYLVSNIQFNGSAIKRFFYTGPGGATARDQFVGAFHSVVCDSEGAIIAQTDANTPVAYGATRRLRSIAGARPNGNSTRAECRTMHANNAGVTVSAGTCTNTNSMFGEALLLLMMIEFNSLDIQAVFSAGFTNMAAWNYSSMRNTGRTASLGNQSGEIEAVDAASGDPDYDIATLWNAAALADHSKRIVACSYRGIENPFGSYWENQDGIQKNQDNTELDITVNGLVYDRDIENDYASGDTHYYAWTKAGTGTIYTEVPHPAVGAATYTYDSDTDTFTSTGYTETAFDEDFSQSGYWCTNDTTLYSRLDSQIAPGAENGRFPDVGYTGNALVWVHHPWPKASGYVLNFDPESFFPTKLGGSANTGLCDYFYNDTNAGARLVYRGGYLYSGSFAGVGCVSVLIGLGFRYAYFGSRLGA